MLSSANHTAKLIHHHVLDIKNITHVFLIWCIRIHESLTAHLSHQGLYSEKIFHIQPFYDKVYSQLNKVNKQSSSTT